MSILIRVLKAQLPISPWAIMAVIFFSLLHSNLKAGAIYGLCILIVGNLIYLFDYIFYRDEPVENLSPESAESKGLEEKLYYRPSIAKYTGVAWSGIVLLLFISITYLYYEEVTASLISLFFVVIAILMLTIAIHVEFSHEAIKVTSILTKYRMEWNEVEALEIGSWVCVFHGKGKKRLVVPTSWSGEDAKSTADFIANQIKMLNLKVVDGSYGEFKFHKNVRVKNI